MNIAKWMVMVLLAVTLGFGVVVPPHEAQVKMTGEEPVGSVVDVPPRLGRQSPGDQVGVTTYDYQANGCMGQRVAVDDTGQIHVNWMYCG